jgi:hypothetical protein
VNLIIDKCVLFINDDDKSIDENKKIPRKIFGLNGNKAPDVRLLEFQKSWKSTSSNV